MRPHCLVLYSKETKFNCHVPSLPVSRNAQCQKVELVERFAGGSWSHHTVLQKPWSLCWNSQNASTFEVNSRIGGGWGGAKQYATPRLTGKGKPTSLIWLTTHSSPASDLSGTLHPQSNSPWPNCSGCKFDSGAGPWTPSLHPPLGSLIFPRTHP